MVDLKEPFALGAEEIRLRVGRYNDDGTPACYQVWIDHRDRNVARSVGVLANPKAAFERAVDAFKRNLAPPPPEDDLEDLFG